MTVSPLTTARSQAPDLLNSFQALAASWRRHLLASNKAPRTIGSYSEALALFGQFLLTQGMPTAVEAISREHLETFVSDQLERHKPATAASRYRSLRVFFGWLLEEGEIERSPMARMHCPVIPEAPPAVLDAEQLKKLVQACEGKAFRERRDMAMIRLLIDSGMRRSECAGLTVADLDFELNIAQVTGKGRRPRACPFGRRAAQAIDRYLRVRAGHPDASLQALWLGRHGPVLSNGVYQIVRNRARQAGLEHIFVHQLRHSFAHSWLSSGGQEGDLMALAGWRSRTMLSRYGASAAAERAREAHHRLSPGDKI